MGPPAAGAVETVGKRSVSTVSTAHYTRGFPNGGTREFDTNGKDSTEIRGGVQEARGGADRDSVIAHLRGREKDLEPFGWSQEHAEWVAMVCLHSGVFTRAQYSAHFNTYPLRAARFVQSLVARKLAVEEPVPVIRPQNRTRACRITYKGIYRALEIPNIRHRRFPDPAVYIRRLLSLDYVIEHPDLHWLPAEDEKVEFCTHYGVPLNRLPHRIYSGAAGNVTRYFPLKLPVAGGPVCTFVYVDPGNDTATELRHWGQAHEHVWAC